MNVSTRAKQSGEEIEEAVPGAGQGEGPSVATAEAKRGSGKPDAVKGGGGGIAADLGCQLCAKPGSSGAAVSGEACGEVQAVGFARVGHDVEREIERAAPDEFDFGVAQL